MKTLKLAAALAFSLAAGQALAWGDVGHKTVGAIADELLKGSRAHKQVSALLLPGETLSSLSVWADCVKGNWCGPQTPEMAEFVKAHPKHNDYHFTNVPFQKDAYRDGEVGTRDIDIVQTLKESIAVLQGKDDAPHNPRGFTKRQALAMVAHLVGDIHQPLHVGEAYVSRASKFVVPATREQVDGLEIIGSAGGNKLLLEDRKYWPARDLAPFAQPTSDGAKREGKSLHVYWDVTVVESAMKRAGTATPQEFAKRAIDGAPAVPATGGTPAAWPNAWANETLGLSKAAYGDLTLVDVLQTTSRRGEASFSWYATAPEAYTTLATMAAERQLVRGGYRLAEVLKAIWPDTARPKKARR